MKTEQEQVKAIKQIIDERVETTLGQVQGRHDNVIKTVDTIIIARDIVNAGYGKVSEYKAEREMLGSQIKVLKQRLNDKYIEVDNLNRDYSNAFERLKAQGREIKKLKEENCELTEKLKARLTCDFVKVAQKHAVQKIVYELRNKCSEVKGYEYSFANIAHLINQLLEEYEK